MKNKKHLFWIIPTSLIGTIVVLFFVIAGVCAIPSARQKLLDKVISHASSLTGYDLAVRRLYLSPFHQSPVSLLTDSIVVEIDSLFIGHAHQDTLLYLHHFSVSALPLSFTRHPFSIGLRDTIPVHHLAIEDAVVHTDSMIEACTIDIVLANLRFTSPGIVLNEGSYPLHGLRLRDADISISLHDTPEDTTSSDTSSLKMAFIVPDGELDDVRFRLEPMGLDFSTHSLQTCALADVGGSLYDVPSLHLGSSVIRFGDLSFPLDTLYGGAYVDLSHQLITTDGLHAVCDSLSAWLDINSTRFDMSTLQVDFAADACVQGNSAHTQGSYNIDSESYDIAVRLDDVDLTPFITTASCAQVSGSIDAEGQGFDFRSARCRSRVHLDLPTCAYDEIDVSGLRLDADFSRNVLTGDLHLPLIYGNSSLSARMESDHQFRLCDIFAPEPQVDYQGRMRHLRAHVMDEDLSTPYLHLTFATDSVTRCDVSSPDLELRVQSPRHLLRLIDDLQPLLTGIGDTALIAGITSCRELNNIDTLCHLIPPLDAGIHIRHNSIVRPLIERYGLDLNHFSLLFHADSTSTRLSADASIPALIPADSTQWRLPATDMQLSIVCEASKTDIAVTGTSFITDGLLSIDDLCSSVKVQADLHRQGHALTGTGSVALDSLSMGKIALGDRALHFRILPSQRYHEGAFMVHAQLDDVPLTLVDSILRMEDVDIGGSIKAHATIDGLPSTVDISAEVRPMDVSVRYLPYEIALSLGETLITMEHNKVKLNGLPIYGTDSTQLSFYGGIDLDSMLLDVTLAADSFAPVRLSRDSKIPVHGDFATAIHGQVYGPFDHFVADADITILPVTDITYPLGKKNMVQICPTGTVHVRYADSLDLGGEIDIDKGLIKYSPKAYPMMPFHVDSGSYVRFHGSVGATELSVSASQKVKASVQAENEDARRVEFNTGVRVKGTVDSVGLNSISFFLEAPKDEMVTQELASVTEETREGLAATLLAMGMYMGESNVAAQKDGYALSSIVNNKINAAMANSKLGKVVDIDISSGEKMHGNNVKSQDLGLTISKSFFKDRFRITVGTTLSDNPDVNKTYGLLNNLTADYKLTKSGSVLLHLFSKRDYDNVLEGELYKSGLGIRALKEWRKPTRDSIMYTYSLTGDCDVTYRSNNSIGPDAALTFSIHNLWGNGEQLSIKGKGAYYWSLQKNFEGDPKNKNTYKLGADVALTFPYLHWTGDNNPPGSTRYIIGYQHENIAGGYAVHKYSASFSYFILTGRHITHTFTPFSLSVVNMNAADPNLLDKSAEYPQLIAVIAGDEFVPSIGYSFTYDDNRTQRAVNTFFDWEIKESGNIINAIYTACGYGWNDKSKPLGSITFDQFIKTSVELHNRFNFTPRICIATRLYAGAVIPLGNSDFAPLSEKYYAGGPNSLRAASPNSYGPGNFFSPKYNQTFFHAGDIKLEANAEFRFPIVWKLNGAVFADVGNVWNWVDTWEVAETLGYSGLIQKFGFNEQLKDGFDVKNLGQQLALGTGFGLRLDIESIIIRLDLGIGLHIPYTTYKYDKKGNMTTTPIGTYYNIPTVWDGFKFNFGIGYPF